MNSDYGHTLLLTDGILIHNEDSLQESRMREICTSGSTRGSGRLAFVLLAPPVALYSTVLLFKNTFLNSQSLSPISHSLKNHSSPNPFLCLFVPLRGQIEKSRCTSENGLNSRALPRTKRYGGQAPTRRRRDRELRIKAISSRP